MYNSSSVQALWEEPCLAARVRRIHRIVVRAYDDALRHRDLTGAQLDVLMTLLRAESPVRRIDLARALHMERSTVTRNLDRLIGRGLVSETVDPNSGETHVAVMPGGREAAEAAADDWYAVQRSTARRLGEDGVAALALVMHRLADR